MRIAVVNGSPSGLAGISAHYVKYLEKRFPEHQFRVHEVARQIHALERDERRFSGVAEDLAAAELVLWAFPVYFMLVSAQLKRFIELLFERGQASLLAGKVTSSLSTSAHHYDHTAHDYMQGICCDLGMIYVRGFSAGANDLLGEDGRNNLLGWAKELFRHAAGELPTEIRWPPIAWSPSRYDPSLPAPVAKTSSKRIAVISDAGPEDQNLERMIEVFERAVYAPVDRIELRELRMAGGCLGCMTCFDDGKCRYQDDYAAAFDQRVRPADVVIYAGAVRDRFLSARMKTFIDRYFSNGHRPVVAGKLVGFLVSGPLQQLPTLRECIEAHIEVGRCQRLGVVTDEQAFPEQTTARLQSMARAAERWLAAPWYTPPTFRGFAAAKNFRDLVYANKGIMSADHRFYRAHGLYDYPQQDRGRRLFNALLLLGKRFPSVRAQIGKKMGEKHVEAHRRLLERL